MIELSAEFGDFAPSSIDLSAASLEHDNLLVLVDDNEIEVEDEAELAAELGFAVVKLIDAEYVTLNIAQILEWWVGNDKEQAGVCILLDNRIPTLAQNMRAKEAELDKSAGGVNVGVTELLDRLSDGKLVGITLCEWLAEEVVPKFPYISFGLISNFTKVGMAPRLKEIEKSINFVGLLEKATSKKSAGMREGVLAKTQRVLNDVLERRNEASVQKQRKLDAEEKLRWCVDVLSMSEREIADFLMTPRSARKISDYLGGGPLELDSELWVSKAEKLLELLVVVGISHRAQAQGSAQEHVRVLRAVLDAPCPFSPGSWRRVMLNANEASLSELRDLAEVF